MLTVKSILALYNACMVFLFHFPCRRDQRIDDADIRHSRKFNGRILFAGPFHADRPGSDYQISAFHIQLHPAAGSYADKSVRPCPDQLFHGDGSRWTSDPGGGHTDLYPVQIPGIGHIFPVVRHQYGIVKILCNLCTPLGIPGQNHIFPDISFTHLNMILFACVF